MSTQITLNSFEELAEVFRTDQVPSGTAQPITYEAPLAAGGASPELADLLAELQRAGATLATIARRDDEARRQALSELERYDALLAQQTEAETVGKRARQVRRQAHELAENAFEDDAREAARRVIQLAERAEAQAAQVASDQRQAVEQLAASMDLERLLTERRRLQALEHRKAAETERARRLSAGLTGARAALQAGRLEEATALLGPLGEEHPDNVEVASLLGTIAQRQLAVKTSAAEEALWSARREYRRDPVTAVARIQALDVDGLDGELVKEVFSVWLRACARLCQERQLSDAVRCSAGFGKAFVAARERADGPHLVVSAVGLAELCPAGSFPNARLMAGARPL